MPHRIFEQSRQRTWLAMGREKERGIKFGCCIKRFSMKRADANSAYYVLFPKGLKSFS